MLQVKADSQLRVVLVTGADQGTLGSVQLLPGTDPLLVINKYYYQLNNHYYHYLTVVPPPPLLAVAAPGDDVAAAAVLALALLLAVLPEPALGTLQLALGVEIFLTGGIDIFSARSKFKEYCGRML